jgi:hypothetical protein
MTFQVLWCDSGAGFVRVLGNPRAWWRSLRLGEALGGKETTFLRMLFYRLPRRNRRLPWKTLIPAWGKSKAEYTSRLAEIRIYLVVETWQYEDVFSSSWYQTPAAFTYDPVGFPERKIYSTQVAKPKE